jgi:O-antigen/teichoic acid export membrane protein
MCAAMSVGWLAVLVFHDIPASRMTETAEMQNAQDADYHAARWPKMLALARKAWPLGVATALFSLEANVPRYVAAFQFDRHDLGIIGTLTYLLAVGQTLVSAVCFPAIPRLAEYFADGQTRLFWQLLRKLCTVGIMIGVAALVAGAVGGFWLLAAFGPEYAAHSRLLMLIIAAGSLQLVLHTFLSALRAMQRFRAVFALQIFSLLTTTVSCLVGTSLMGLNGIGWGLLASLTCSVLICASLIRISVNRVVSATGPLATKSAYGSFGKQPQC